MSKNNDNGFHGELITGATGIHNFAEGLVKRIPGFITSVKNHISKSNKSVTTEMIRKKSKVTTKTTDLGYSINFKKALKFTDFEFKKHSLVVGASGFGKTSLFHILFEYNMAMGLPIVFIDPKGNTEDFEKFKKLANFYNKKLYVFSDVILGDQTRNFNPIRELTDTKIVSLIMSTLDWTGAPAFFIAEAEVALLKVMKQITDKEQVPSIPLIYETLVKLYDDDANVAGLRSQLFKLINNDLGKLLGDNDRNHAITIEEAVNEGSCVYISVNTQAHHNFARTIGKMFVNEILQVSAKRNSETVDPSNFKPFVVFIDELGSVIEPNFLELINKCRSAKIQIFGACQSPYDLDIKNGDRSVLASLWECFSNIFIFKLSSPDTIEKLSRLIGTKQSMKTTKQINDNAETGGGSLREVEEFIIHPNDIKNLITGRCIFVDQAGKRDIHLVAVRDPATSPAYLTATPAIEIRSYKRVYNRKTETDEVTPEKRKNKKMNWDDYVERGF